MSYMTTSTINGRYAYRAWDGQWYIVGGIVEKTGYPTRIDAVAALRRLPR